MISIILKHNLKTKVHEKGRDNSKGFGLRKKINRNKIHATLKYKGHSIYLGCPRCQAEFESDPERYIKEIKKNSH